MINKFKKSFLLGSLALIGVLADATAKPNVMNGNRPAGKQRTAAEACRDATAIIDLDINNVRARLMTGGDMWWDRGTSEALYIVPKGTVDNPGKKSSLFAGSVWLGGYDPQGNLKVAAQTYRQTGNDYWPGPLDDRSNISKDECANWDRFWKVTKSTVLEFQELYATGGASAVSDDRFTVIREWPAKDNPEQITNASGTGSIALLPGRDYAPFVDVDGDGIYDYKKGDYPQILGDQFIWWVFNDKGNIKGETKTDAISVEVQASAFAFSTKDYMNDATFYKYRLINRGVMSLDSAYIATWTDADLGFYNDDYIGCDVSRDLGIIYNGKSVDGNGETNSYGSTVPMAGVDFFIGPKSYYTLPDGRDTFRTLGMSAFTYYNNDFSNIGNPGNGIDIYGYMTGSIRNGQRFSNDWDGIPGHQSVGYGSGPIIPYVYTGDPSNSNEWSECVCRNEPADRRFIHSSGPFKLESGARGSNDITIGVVWVSDVGGCPNTNFKKIRAADDLAQGLFESDFKILEGPEAPDLTIRELDNKLVLYLTNDNTLSNNYQEKFGYDTAAKYIATSVKSRQYPDSLYKFEGYRVFQLKNGSINATQIFGANGEVNTELAAEIFQCDIKNNVARIVNYGKRDEVSDTTWIPQIKVNGKNQGLSHSFTVTEDAFATGNNKKLVNYRNYYFVAIAYAHNNFRAFSANLPDSTQDEAYLESSKAAGGTPIKVYAAMPNPANGDMGTVLNSDYGSGVSIKRLEGIGNGGNFLQMTKASEEEALSAASGYKSKYTVYEPGRGPVDIKVVDPVKVVGADWELAFNGTVLTGANAPKGIVPNTGSWTLIKQRTATEDADTIYSQKDFSLINDQILSKYGLSVSVVQVYRPGDRVAIAPGDTVQVDNNGYIGSDITYTDPSKSWLAGINYANENTPYNWLHLAESKDSCYIESPTTIKDINAYYSSLLEASPSVKGSWAPYALLRTNSKTGCGTGVGMSGTTSSTSFSETRGIDVIFTNDKSKWTRCMVFEMQDVPTLAEGSGVEKFFFREHPSWNMEMDNGGNPVYATDDSGRSWFPGYAIDQETGERLNIGFGEDSWLGSDNGKDMLWNPTSTLLNNVLGHQMPIFGGKHYVFVFQSKYDEGVSARAEVLKYTKGSIQRRSAYQALMRTAMWAGATFLAPGQHLLPLKDGLIPTETRIRLRVTRPYNMYMPDSSVAPQNNRLPLYSFSTTGLNPTKIGDANYNGDKQALLDRIHVVPNPYYAYAGYENNRLDTRVRIINLPQKATISIFTLDGSLVRRLEKDNANVSYIDWDVRNLKGLPIASGMYLVHVKAEGIGETIIRWFGAMRPVDVTNY